MKHSVFTYRNAGLDAKWSRTREGKPIIVVRDPQSGNAHQRNQWWQVTAAMFEDMKKDGVREAFDTHTLLGDVFSIKA